MPLYIVKLDKEPGDDLLGKIFDNPDDAIHKLSEKVFLLFSHRDPIGMKSLMGALGEKFGYEVFTIPTTPVLFEQPWIFHLELQPSRDLAQLESLLRKSHQETHDRFEQFFQNK